jgi:hypothetical protein
MYSPACQFRAPRGRPTVDPQGVRTRVGRVSVDPEKGKERLQEGAVEELNRKVVGSANPLAYEFLSSSWLRT